MEWVGLFDFVVFDQYLFVWLYYVAHVVLFGVVVEEGRECGFKFEFGVFVTEFFCEFFFEFERLVFCFFSIFEIVVVVLWFFCWWVFFYGCFYEDWVGVWINDGVVFIIEDFDDFLDVVFGLFGDVGIEVGMGEVVKAGSKYFVEWVH